MNATENAMAIGTVEIVNQARAIFLVRFPEDTYGYFRVPPETMPRAGDQIEIDSTDRPFPRAIRNLTGNVRAIRVFSGILGLPRHVAVALAA